MIEKCERKKNSSKYIIFLLKYPLYMKKILSIADPWLNFK